MKTRKSQRIDNENHPFWTIHNPGSKDQLAPVSESLLMGWLQVPNQRCGLKKRYFVLTKYAFFYCKSQSDIRIRKKGTVSWWTLQPFYQPTNTSDQFGFRLSGGDFFEDFYTETPEDLDVWIECLSKLTILIDLEDDFVIQKELGRGKFGKIYLASEYYTRNVYAIKCLSKENSKHQYHDNHLRNEIEIMRKLNHPRILKLHYLYESENDVKIVEDYVKGGELTSRIKRLKRYSESLAILFMKNLLEAVEYIHSQGVVHRDLKPDNILLVSAEDHEKFKIIDFGLSAQFEKDNELTSKCGTPGYIAPEILRDQNYGTKSDIFSVGVICYQILSGKHPFEGREVFKVLRQNRDCKIIFYESDWNLVSLLAQEFVTKLTNPNPIARPSAREALEDPWLNSLWDDRNPDLKNYASRNKHIFATEFQRDLNRNLLNSEHKSQKSNERVLAMLETTSKNQNVNYDTLRKKKHYTTLEACTTTDESKLFDTLIIWE